MDVELEYGRLEDDGSVGAENSNTIIKHWRNTDQAS